MRLQLLALIVLAGCSAQPDLVGGDAIKADTDRPNTTTFTRGSGGSVVTALGFGIRVNANSTLEREWITAHDTLSPVQFTGNMGVTTAYESGERYSTGSYEYRSRLSLQFKEDVTAFEIRFVLFDVWGRFNRTLSSTEVEDVSRGDTKTYSPRWNVYSENEVSEHYASLAYVARVRTATGRVSEANYAPIVTEIATISSRFDPAWLDPHPMPRPDSSRSMR